MMGSADGIMREAIESRCLASIGYAPERQVLAIEFKSGLILHYSGISLELALACFCAESRGRFYAQHIRGQFPAAVMTGPCGACGSNGIVGTICADCGCDQHYRVERRSEPTKADRPEIGPVQGAVMPRSS